MIINEDLKTAYFIGDTRVDLTCRFSHDNTMLTVSDKKGKVENVKVANFVKGEGFNLVFDEGELKGSINFMYCCEECPVEDQ